MVEQSSERIQDPFLHDTLLHVSMISEAALPYKPGDAQSGYLFDIADAKHFALQHAGLPVAMPFEETERVLAEIVKRVSEGQVLPPRAPMVDETIRTAGDVIAAHGSSVMKLVEQIGMVRKGAEEDYSAIDLFRALFVIEGGANKTSIVRRAVAERAMRAVFGHELQHEFLFQFGSNRLITPTLTNAATKETRPNPEFNTIRALAPELAADDPFTEFQANLATALVDGYFVDGSLNYKPGQDTDIPTIILKHVNPLRPSLCLVQLEGGGLGRALDALTKVTNITSRQIVVASNGQYRPKNKVVLRQFADRHPKLELLEGVAIGDEPGDVAPYAQTAIETPARPLSAYVNEIPIYYREARKVLSANGGQPDSAAAPDTILMETIRPDGASVRLTKRGVELILTAA